jgi:FKBP-type peptidyl-prolyl cis-trans isomerase
MEILMPHPNRLLSFLLALAALAATPFATACADDPAPAPAPAKPGGIPDDTEVKTTASGLQYSVLVAGKDGPHPKRGDKVKVHYTGWLTNGTKFDSSRDRGVPADFTVGQLVEGWNEALCLMTAGAKWKLTIPAKIGYGERGSPPTIPANATLVFELELIEFTAFPEFHAPDPKAQTKTESGLKYETLTAGTGEAPAADDVLELKFALWSEKGTLLDCSERSGATVKLPRTDLPLPFMKEAAGLLRKGARLRFEVPPDLCFGAQPQGPALPANSVTIWELELVGTIKPLPVPAFVMPDDAKLQKTASGLQYEVVEQGEGESPKMGSKVLVHYAGWFTDGKLFDSSYGRGEPAEMRVGMVIPGWNEGLQMMKPGATYRFVIPPQLAYGPRGAPPKIAPNTTLVFVVKLVKVL